MVLEAIRYNPEGESPAKLEILDQLLLPHRSVYMPIDSSKGAWDAIKRMNVRGAPAIAIVAALSLAAELSFEKQGNLSLPAIKKSIFDRLIFLESSRPTAVNLAHAVRKLKAVVRKAAEDEDASGDSVARAYIAAAEEMLVDDLRDNEAIGKYGAEWIRNHTKAGTGKIQGSGSLKVLTHCNTGSLATAGYGTALGIVRALHAEDILTHAFCSETRPYNQGSRLTAYELVHDGIPATLITDSMAASLMTTEGDSLAAIIVGADRVAANGDTANKIGTYSLAILAKYHGVKFVVAAPRTTIDLGTSSGKDIVIEQRPGEEVTKIKGPRLDDSGELVDVRDSTAISIAAKGINVWNPAFDITPAALIDVIVTEVGAAETSLEGHFDLKQLF